MGPSASEFAGAPSRRVDSVDFWRGIVLCTIFINHIPGNLFEFITQKNYGFSDSAEAFVFLSGVSLALAYAPRFAKSQAAEAFASLARRAVRLYGLHILLSLAGVGIFAAAAMAMADPALLEAHGRDLFVDDPRAALIGLLSLGHQLGYFNILPLYIVLLGPAALMLWAGHKRPWAMLAASLALYLVARALNLNVPTWPMQGSWFFDPFAWQFMLALGVCAGVVLRKRAVPRPKWLIVAALVVSFASAGSVTDAFGLMPGLQDWTAGWADLNKSVLGAGRILHFVAIAYVVAALDPVRLLRRGLLFGPMCRLGRHSLGVFALLSLLAAFGQVIAAQYGHPPLLDVIVLTVGFTLLFGAATLLEQRRADHLLPVPATASV